MENDTANKIIDTALSLFATKGFVAVSIREIADAAQVNSSAISYYFKGKEGLYQAVLEKTFLPIDKLLRSVETMTNLKAIERLTMYAQNVAIIHRERPFLTNFMMSEIMNPTTCGQGLIKKHISRLYKFVYLSLCAGVEQGDFAPDLNLNYATISMAGIMNFYFITTPLFKELTPLSDHSGEDYVVQALKIYLDGIRKH